MKAKVTKWKKATHGGPLKIGEMELTCAVLEDGTRLVSQREVFKALGKASGGRSPKIENLDGGKVPPFLASNNLIPFIDRELLTMGNEPIVFKPKGGGPLAHGIKAEAIPMICNVWLKARDAGVLKTPQLKVAKNAEMLMRGLAHVGITALIDEVTGYQADRDKDALQKILEAYVAKEFLPWTRKFPESFYQELFRLKQWQYRPLSPKRPKMVGRLTADLVYEQLPEGVLAELRKKNPTNESGNRLHRHHQFLTNDIGNPHLSNQVASVVTLMKISPNWRTFQGHFNRAFTKAIQQDMLEDEEGGDRTKKGP